MTLRNRRFAWLLALLAAFSLIAAACGDDDDDAADDEGDTTEETEATDDTEATEDTEAADDTDEGDEEAGGDLSGSVFVSGSSTVEPISALVGEEFSGQNPGVGVTVDGPGTGDGFQLFCNGESDISDASRPIADDEVALCEENGIEYVELQVAIDGITVATSPANEAVACLDNEGIYALVGPESTGFSQWSDANDLAAELGSAYGPFPEAPLDITGPGEESGTYDTFVELTIEDLADERGQDAATRPDYNSSPNDNVIVQGIEGSDTSFGWVGYAFYVEEEDRMKAIAIDGGDGSCVEPNPETIASGEYPLSRPLFIYVNTAKAAENPAVAGYVDLYMSDFGFGAVADAGYVQLEDATWSETVSAWEGVAP